MLPDWSCHWLTRPEELVTTPASAFNHSCNDPELTDGSGGADPSETVTHNVTLLPTIAVWLCGWAMTVGAVWAKAFEMKNKRTTHPARKRQLRDGLGRKLLLKDSDSIIQTLGLCARERTSFQCVTAYFTRLPELVKVFLDICFIEKILQINDLQQARPRKQGARDFLDHKTGR